MICPICRADGTVLVLDLGDSPVTDHFPPLRDVGPDPRHPLQLRRCRACGIAFLEQDESGSRELRVVEPRALREQAGRAVATLRSWGVLGPGTTVREHGSPHGDPWWPLLAAAGARRPGDDEPADLVLDVFALMHDRDVEAALRDRVRQVAPGGALLLQVHSLSAILQGRQWSALRHGHHWYLSLQALRHLLARQGFGPVSCLTDPLYGGTLLVLARRDGAPDEAVRAELDREIALRWDDPRTFDPLQQARDGAVADLVARARRAGAAGRTVHAWGAGSRAVVLLAAAWARGVAPLSVADAAPSKWGRRLPGTGIPIVSPADLLAAVPDEIWVLIPELLPELQRDHPAWADRFVVVGTDQTDPAEPADPADPTSTALRPGPVRHLPVSTRWQSRLHDLVPGGSHTQARGSDQYPDGLAPVLTHGRGARVWDVDGHEYVEYGMGLRSVTLGHAHPAVTAAVERELRRGTSFSRPTVLEAAAAEDFLALVPGADMVKFAKNGSDATTAAVKLARAATGRTVVAVANQPFFSVHDWFIGATPMPAGVPQEDRARTVRFRYNDLDSLAAVLAAHPVAAVVLEPAGAAAEPDPGYLAGVRALCDRFGTVLVFDEIITGFRWSAGGAQRVYGVTPDLSCWGKAMGNGVPVAALAGRRELMEAGGLRTTGERVFLLSTTHGPESLGLAAFRAVAREYVDDAPVRAMEQAGAVLVDQVGQVLSAAGLERSITLGGRPSCLVFGTADAEGRPSQVLRTVFLAGLIGRGVLGQSFVVSAAHDQDDLARTVDAVVGVLPVYRRVLESGTLPPELGRPVAPALRPYAAPRHESTPMDRDGSPSIGETG